MNQICAAAVFCLLAGSLDAAEPVRVLIFSGQNNHAWRETTPVLRKILADSGKFAVDVTEHPEHSTAETLAKVDVIVSNWNTFGPSGVRDWPPVTRRAYIEFVRGGRGVVVVHAGSSSFYDWPDYQAIAGASWKMGQTTHGAPHTFTVKPTGVDHPITRGVQPFMSTDELWIKPGVDPAAVILATAEGQAIALVMSFGKGRGFSLLLGHNAKFMENAGFRTLLLRGTEWAGAGKVGPES